MHEGDINLSELALQFHGRKLAELKLYLHLPRILFRIDYTYGERTRQLKL